MSDLADVTFPGEAAAFLVRVAADRREFAAAYARRHRLEIGPAVSFDPEEPRASALEHVLAALGADLATGLVRLARPRGVELHGVSALGYWATRD